MDCIALIGIACELPNDIHSPHALWDFITNNIHLQSEIRTEQTDYQSTPIPLLDTNPSLNSKPIERSYLLKKEILNGFDPEFFGECVVLILLKRLSDAIRDCDQIYCVIRDVLSHRDNDIDMKNCSSLFSNAPLQLLNEIYNVRNQTDLSQVFYIEEHGIITTDDNLLEENTIGEFFHRGEAEQPLLLGTVKSKIGDTDGAAGIVALIKVALSIKHRMIPPQMTFGNFNPKIKFKEYNLQIVENLTIFPLNQPIIIGINCKNSHAIVEEWINSHYSCSDKPMLYQCSEETIADVVQQQQHYVAVISGPQWWKMGRELYNSEPVFRQWINKISTELETLTNEWSLIRELIDMSDEKSSHINETNIAQPAIFAVQVALTALWLSWGIYPRVIVGHSVGEVAAAYVGGRLILTEACKVIYHYSRLQHRNTRQGGRMLAVIGLEETEARSLLQGVENRVSFAAINSPTSVTYSGYSTELEQLYQSLAKTKPNVFKTWIRLENALHSPLMDNFNIYQDLLKSLSDINGDYSTIQENDMFDK
ncbi:unnamed protein product [Rotaria sordida]|uniref:Ketosynthase family 3 (KS3) domain-containing protein n=1 Tax=Rotaria sordida TaxID=392033 RepID=A0A814SHM9_9BILA|nr:unnamed protein product [Rotaria sordida]CAF1383882.1 unnamed protein product [Rotaria sordida]